MVCVHDISTFFRKDVEDIALAELTFAGGFFFARGADSNDSAKFRTILYFAKENKPPYNARLKGIYVGKCE
jgi:hypothetical protein